MKEFQIPSLEVFMSTWTPAQVVLAVDGMFWNGRKEQDKYTDSPYQIATARPLTARQLAGLE